MNDFKFKKYITEMNVGNIYDSKTIITQVDRYYLEQKYTMYNSSDIEVVDDMVKFDGSANDGLIWTGYPNQQNYIITTTKSSYFLELDFLIDETSNKVVSLMICMNNTINLISTFALYTYADKNWVFLNFFNSSQGHYGAWNGYYKFVKGVKYNLKLLVLSNNNFGVYINDKLICIGNTKNKTDRGSGTPQTSINSSATYFLGMQVINGVNSNLTGKLNNFRLSDIYSDDTIIYDTSIYSKNKLVNIPFDYNNVVAVGNAYTGESIKNLGVKELIIPYKSTTTYESQFVTNLGGSFISWFKPLSTTPIYLESLYLNNLNKFSISMRIKTGAVLVSCALIDTRTTTGVYDGFLLTIPNADTTSLRFYYCNDNIPYDNSTAWFDILSPATGIIQPNSEYLITVIFNNGKFELYLDGVKISESLTDNIKSTILATNMYFGDNSKQSSIFDGYIRDITIYDSNILPQDDIYANPLSDNGDYVYDYTDVNPDNVYINNTKPLELSVYESTDTMYISTNIFQRLYYYVEGSNGNKTLELYNNVGLLYNTYDNTIKYDYITDFNKWNIRIVEEDRYVSLVTLSDKRGELSGDVFLSNCDGANVVDLFIRCYSSSDHRFIGDFDIVYNMYNIPNLDATIEYDIILVDRSETLEQKILSKRKPTAY